MKTLGEVEVRIRKAIEIELAHRLRREVLPHHCRHNHRQPLDHRRAIYGEPNENYNRVSLGVVDGVSLPVLQTVGLCMLGAETPGEWEGTICEDPIDAQRCPKFEQRVSADTLYREFLADVQNPVWLEANLPHVCALLWVVEAGIAASAVRQPWWVRLWWWVLRGPLRKISTETTEISVYLPPPPNVTASEHRPRAPLGNGASPAPL
jgi:hypothetical protein